MDEKEIKESVSRSALFWTEYTCWRFALFERKFIVISSQKISKKISTQLLIMEIDFCPVDQMAWVRAANQHRAIAEEIILKELIYI